MIQPLDDWDQVLKKAWSVKFSIAAVLLGAAETIVALVQPVGIPTGLFAGIGMLASLGAIVARALSQGEDNKEIAAEVVQEMRNGQPPE